MPVSVDGTDDTARQARCVMLTQDNKPICLTRCNDDLPLEIPTTWTIVEYRQRSALEWHSLPHFQLFPEPQSSHQKKEWGSFLSYIKRRSMVAVAKTGYSSFYILSPDKGCSHCKVYFSVKKSYITSDRQENVVSVDGHPRHSKYSLNLYQKSRSTRALENGRESVIPSPNLVASFEDKIVNPDSLNNNIGDDAPENSCQNVKSAGIVSSKRVSLIEEIQFEDVNMNSRTLQAASDKIMHSGASNLSATKLSSSLQRNFVKTDPSYLTTLSQSHSGWVFGAIVELVDNSRDAHAKRLDICIEHLYSKKDGKKIPVLSVVDDGDGMTYNEILRMLSFGHKQTTGENQGRIGRFGIGFKTGAMKLGRDALVLTQSSRSRSVAFLSQTYNENKDNVEIPVVSYIKNGRYMEIDQSAHSEEYANFNLSVIKDFSPFNEYFLGEKLGLFGEKGTGTQIFIWNLEKWGSDYTLEWVGGTDGESHNQGQGDILIRSRRIRSRLGQISHEVPLDFSLQAYLEVIFLDPCMKMYVQGSLVKCYPLEKSLGRTRAIKGSIMARPIELILGQSQVEWERMNCGIFLYWNGRLIEAYKRVGCMKYNADVGRGIIGVADVTGIMGNEKGRVWVLNNKQGFQDCEAYAKLEDWLGKKADEYWDENFDTIDVKENCEEYETDSEWVQCNKCRKWRTLSAGFNVKDLPKEWFCYMPPFNGSCEAREQKMAAGVVTVAANLCQHDSGMSESQFEHASHENDECDFDSPANNSCRRTGEDKREDVAKKNNRNQQVTKTVGKLKSSVGNVELKTKSKVNFKKKVNSKKKG
ncbi:hypothetical protein HPP92_003837 [Vanilla planifolia]|uniref:CW-type domain-containing protein n=1 Tax=Vanilla planifolia TaxID=51239 RepID=A0A835RVN2_VANPL|nr:hypothetical protein HPP92_003837 [Vanilla planifolia]